MATLEIIQWGILSVHTFLLACILWWLAHIEFRAIRNATRYSGGVFVPSVPRSPITEPCPPPSRK